ncbi:uncharacterized protein [Onthophagus taurus]|uniref:uncharacterized protein n=1 Tax=Onthophagus taurus TaxID=166361 RepID=UPI000C207217|nr:uncharacterized protein LOC111419896 [Onthophagus taurus]
MNLMFKIIILISLFLIVSSNPINLVKDLVQFNVFGHPFLHKDSKWDFDPEAGHRRSRQYQEINGYHGEKAIERLGLGIDGYDLERLEKQRERDKGQLGGVNYITKEFL